MNYSEANAINIIDYLARFGFTPYSNKGNNYFYFSPFREETKPSFKVNNQINKWYDFGEGQGGGLVKLAARLHNTTDLEVLQIIGDEKASVKPRFKNDIEQYESIEKSDIETYEIKPLSNYILKKYLISRYIKINLIDAYCKEINYKMTDKETLYFALCFGSNSGGYEIRNKLFKGCLFKKDITTFKGIDSDAKTVYVFEGFMDFLSWITFNNITTLKDSIIVLNGTAQKVKAIDEIKKQGYESIFLFLDTDTPGYNTANEIIKIFPFAVNQSAILFKGEKDFNNYLFKINVNKWR